MDTFEYLVIKESLSRLKEEIERRLNSLGSEGWRLINVIREDPAWPESVLMIFIREKSRVNVERLIQEIQALYQK